MADKTAIEWADATWNPIRGCSRVSEGCRNCYAEAVAGRFSAPGMPYHGVAEMRPTKNGRKAAWTNRITFIPSALRQPLIWKQPRVIFVNSMSDLFHPDVTNDMLDQIMAIIALSPRHAFVSLTKRPEQQLEYLNDPAMPDRVRQILLLPKPDSDMHAIKDGQAIVAAARAVSEGPLPNLWVGASVEDQATADARIPHLLATRAGKRLISAEPLLGSIDLTPPANDTYQMLSEWYGPSGFDETGSQPRQTRMRGYFPKIDWLIVGGESGLGARPMHPDWSRSLRDQCVAADVPFFFKQWGGWENVGTASAIPANDNRSRHTWPDGTVMRLSGKKNSGAKLDGREWRQMPFLADRIGTATAEVV